MMMMMMMMMIVSFILVCVLAGVTLAVGMLLVFQIRGVLLYVLFTPCCHRAIHLRAVFLGSLWLCSFLVVC